MVKRLLQEPVKLVHIDALFEHLWPNDVKEPPGYPGSRILTKLGVTVEIILLRTRFIMALSKTLEA